MPTTLHLMGQRGIPTLRDEVGQVGWEKDRDRVEETGSAIAVRPQLWYSHSGFLISRMWGLAWAGFGIRQTLGSNSGSIAMCYVPLGTFLCV